MELWGRLPNFFESFLSGRKIRVRVGSTFSNLHKQEEGVHQESILSVSLFNMKIKSITKCLISGILDYLYIDDFTIIFCPVGLSCKIHRLLLCGWVRPHPNERPDMTHNNLMVMFQSFGEYGVPLHCHRSHVHSAMSGSTRLVSYL